MSKKIVLSFIFLYSANSFAHVNPKILDILDGKVGPEISCNLDDKDFNACVKDICADATTNTTYQDIFDEVLADVNKVKDAKFEGFKKDVSTYLKNDIIQFEQLLSDYKNAAELAKTQITPELASVHKIMSLFSKFQTFDFDDLITGTKIDDHHMELIFDDSKLRKALNVHANQAPIYHEMMKNPDVQVLMFAGSYGWTLSNQSRYPGLTSKEVIQKELDEYNQLRERLKKENPKAYSLFNSSSVINQNILDKVLTEENPSEPLQDDFFTSLNSARLMINYTLNGMPEFNKLQVKTLGDLYSAFEIGIASVFNKSLLDDIKADSKILQAKQDHCSAIFLKNQSALPTEDEVKDFAKSANNVRDSIKKNMSISLSKETAAALGKEMDKIYFGFPSSKNESSFLMLERLKSLLNDQKVEAKKLSGEDKSVDTKEYKLTNIHSFMNLQMDSISSALKDMCNEFELKGLNDATYRLGTGKVVVSWLSVKKPNTGKAVVAHELGHALSMIIRSKEISEHSAKKFIATRQCLSKLQPNTNPQNEAVYFKNNKNLYEQHVYQISQYVEGNWSDLIAAKFLPKDASNFGCFMISEKDGKYAENNLAPLSDEGTHSPNLFRLLHMNYLKEKSLPKSCLEVMNADEQKQVMTDCLQ